MLMPTMDPKIKDLLAETKASLMDLHTLFARLKALRVPEDRARFARMSPDDTQRLLNRARALPPTASDEERALANEYADTVEALLGLGPWLKAARARAEALRLEYEAVEAEALDTFTVPTFHELKRVSRQPGHEALVPQVQAIDNALRKLRSNGRGRGSRRAKRTHGDQHSKAKKPEQTEG